MHVFIYSQGHNTRDVSVSLNCLRNCFLFCAVCIHFWTIWGRVYWKSMSNRYKFYLIFYHHYLSGCSVHGIFLHWNMYVWGLPRTSPSITFCGWQLKSVRKMEYLIGWLFKKKEGKITKSVCSINNYSLWSPGTALGIKMKELRLLIF